MNSPKPNNKAATAASNLPATYNYAELHNTITALESLHKHTAKQQSHEIHNLITNTFDHCSTIYKYLLRQGVTIPPVEGRSNANG